MECRITDWIDTEACNRSHVHAHMFQEILHNTCFFLTCQTAMAMSMLRRLCFGLPLWSPKGVGRFTPPHSWPWQHKFAPKVSAGFAHRADEVLGKPCGVDPSIATPLHVSVTETELRDVAKTKECSLPGVSFHRKNRSWNVHWFDEKLRNALFSIAKLEKQGMTECAASLTALRAAIATQNEVVASRSVQAELQFDDEELRTMVETKKCKVPGVHYDKSKNRWVAQWYEQGKEQQRNFPVKKFKADGFTEAEASLAALRAAIDLRQGKVGLQNRNRMKMISIVPEDVWLADAAGTITLRANRSWSGRREKHPTFPCCSNSFCACAFISRLAVSSHAVPRQQVLFTSVSRVMSTPLLVPLKCWHLKLTSIGFEFRFVAAFL